MRPEPASSWSASLVDSLLVFALVILVGSIASIVILNDLGRYWAGVEGALRKVGPPAASPTPGPSPGPTVVPGS